jgi:predicted DNA-binding transcriptional regulator YafY
LQFIFEFEYDIIAEMNLDMEFSMAEKNRPLYIIRYLWDNTDENHPATIKDICAHLEDKGLTPNRKTVAAALLELQDSGFDIVCNRSRQNKYFIGSRILEIAELKTIVDAVRAAKFISPAKSHALIEKLSAFASPFQAKELQGEPFADGIAKTANEGVYYTVDLLHYAINNEKTVEFQYSEYTADKEKVLKHCGAIYRFSPYDLIWNNDRYYVFGWSERHGKVVKFRVDRMVNAKQSMADHHPRPADYDIKAFCSQVFMMYDGEPCRVKLRCSNDMMNTIVDRFGDDVKIIKVDDASFIAEADVFTSATFCSWIFAYGGAISIVSPQKVVDEYKKKLSDALQSINQ